MSEFGKGLTYCLGLFLAHTERNLIEMQDSPRSFCMTWFNCASDHLYELDASQIKDKKLKSRINRFAKKCLRWGHGFMAQNPTFQDYEWAIGEATKLLFLIDQYFGIPVEKGDFE